MKNVNLVIGVGVVLSICLSICLSGCAGCSNEKENMTCRELFEKYKPRDIAIFAEVVVSANKMDSTTAVVYADSMFNYLYAIDSTYVKMNKKEFREFIDKYRFDALKHCDSIFGIIAVR